MEGVEGPSAYTGRLTMDKIPVTSQSQDLNLFPPSPFIYLKTCPLVEHLALNNLFTVYFSTMPIVSDSPPRAPPIKYIAPLGTRWDKEKMAAGGAAAFDLPTDPKNIGPWILGECVGKGASGRVKIAKHRRTGQLAAVKILPIAPLVSSRASLATQQAKSDKQRLGIDREITMMKLMNHPNIMRIYDVFEGDKELFLVLEYVEGGELFDFLVNRGRLPPNEALIYFRQIVYGLNYAHTFSIIHRDLKPENILIASLQPPLIKIADWGMAAFAPPTLQLETSCGSPHYASPEIVNGEKYQGNATDIWSCGVILYALLTGRLPFDDKNVRSLLSKVKSGKYEMPSWIDPLAKDLLSRMLIVDVNKRITVCAQFFSSHCHRPTSGTGTRDSISSLVSLAGFSSLPLRRWKYNFCSSSSVASFPKHPCSSHYFPQFNRFRAFFLFANYLGKTRRSARGIYPTRFVRTSGPGRPCQSLLLSTGEIPRRVFS